MRIRSVWKLRIESDEFLLRSRWFLLWISAGAKRPDMLDHWQGIEVDWLRREPPEEGNTIFVKQWRHEFLPPIPEQRYA